MPLYLCYHVGTDANVQRWFGSFILWPVIFAPVTFLLLSGFHVHFKRPSRFLAVLCLIGSNVGILVASDRLALSAFDLSNQLYATDCDTFQNKYLLQREWDAAHVYYANCLAREAPAKGLDFDMAAALWRIDDCEDYETVSRRHPDWAYLAHLERVHDCGGWCSPGQPLWSRKLVKDACSQVVGEIVKSKVEHCMMQNVIYSIISLCVATSALMTLGPSIWTEAGCGPRASSFGTAAHPAEFGKLD